MAWPLLVVPFLIAQAAPAAAPADKPAATAVAPAAIVKPAVGEKALGLGEATAAEAPENKPAAKPPAGKAAVPAPADGMWNMIITFGPIVLIAYIMILRPQKKRETNHKQLLNNLKKNDKVVTTGGICGTVMSTDPASDRVVVRVDDDKGVKLTFTKASIVRVIEPQAEKAAESSS